MSHVSVAVLRVVSRVECVVRVARFKAVCVRLVDSHGYILDTHKYSTTLVNTCHAVLVMTVLHQRPNELGKPPSTVRDGDRRAQCSRRVVGLYHVHLRPSNHSAPFAWHPLVCHRLPLACLHACLPRLRRLRVALVARANSQATPAAARSAIVRVPKARVQELVVKFRHLRRQRLVGQACRCLRVALLLSRDAGHGRQLSH